MEAFIKDKTLRIAALLIGGAVTLTAVAVGWFTQPDRFAKGFAPRQPIAISHKLHAGTLKIPCLYCHTNARRSRHAGVPSAEKCMNCHRVTKTESPEIKKLAAIVDFGGTLAWRRVHSMPDHVFFDHRPHVAAGVDCRTCHGKIEEMEVVTQKMSMRMSNCLGCHRDPRAALPKDSLIVKGPEHCTACHR